MKIAIIASNYLKLDQTIKKGSEINVYELLLGLSKKSKTNNLQITLFASGNSQVPVKIESIMYLSTFEDKQLNNFDPKFFELALISKALTMESQFDLFHFHISCGELILPFAPLVKKPILITLHGNLNTVFQKKYFKLYPPFSNVYFVSISKNQRKPIPGLNYVKTIYHGIDTNKFSFSLGFNNDFIMWAGRAVPQKGFKEALSVIDKVNKKGKIFALPKTEYLKWFEDVLKLKSEKIEVELDFERERLITFFQSAKVFLNPIQWEEPFGLVMIESMACGTPVVAFARGSVPELIKDGKTGFIVNPSDDDIRGDWIIKKTGIEGLCEAVERIYSMPEKEYQEMRYNCRKHVEKHFTAEKMVDEYIKVYKKLIRKKEK